MTTSPISDRDLYGLDNARLQARYSKDPSTKVGAAIVRLDGTLASVGRNGFPMGARDLPERLQDRDFKLDLTIHAEENAILLAGGSVAGCTLYVWPWSPCCRCAARIIQAGLHRVVTIDRHLPARWQDSMERAGLILREAGVRFDVLRESDVLQRQSESPYP